MKCSKSLKIILNHGWYVKSQKGSHIKLINPINKEVIIFPDYCSDELGKGLQKKLFKQAGIE